MVEIWLKDNIQASMFSIDMWQEIFLGFNIVSVHPTMNREVRLLIQDLPLNIKDPVVIEYVARFGGKIIPPNPQFVKARSGLWGAAKWRQEVQSFFCDKYPQYALITIWEEQG